MRRFQRLCSVFVAICAFVTAGVPAARAQQSESRFAFVIGSDGYEGAPLATAANDAGLVAETLRSAGFDVTGARNLDQDTLRASYREFLEKVAAAGPGAVSAIYLSGYGLQVEGENYLVPVGGRVVRDTDVSINALRISDITRALVAMPGRAHFIILDLAHAGPFGKQGQPLAPGLAIIEGEPNTLIAFNAAPGVFAPAASGNYSPYAQALSEMMRVPGLSLDDVFARVRTRVAELTKGAVVPWHVSKLDPAFRLLEAAAGAPEQITTARIAAERARPIREFTAAEAYSAALDRDTLRGYEEFLAAFPGSPYAKNVRGILAARREAVTWRASAATNSPNAYWSYLRRYPKGPHAADARRRLTRLTAPAEPPNGFQMIEYDVGPPPQEEALYFDEPAPVYYDAAVPVMAPLGYMAPPPAWYAPPPPPANAVIVEEIYYLPTSAAPPPPPWVVVPNYVAQPVEYESLRRAPSGGGSIVPYVAIPAALAAGIIAGKLISNRNARLQNANQPGGPALAPGAAPGQPPRQPFMPSVVAPPRPLVGGQGQGLPPGAGAPPRPSGPPVVGLPPQGQQGRPPGGNVLPGLPGAAPLPGGPAGLPAVRPGLPPQQGQGLPAGQRPPPGAGIPPAGQGGVAPVGRPGVNPRPGQPVPGQFLPGQAQGQPLVSPQGGQQPVGAADLRRQRLEQQRLQQQQRIEQQRQLGLERQQKLQAEREQRRQQLQSQPRGPQPQQPNALQQQQEQQRRAIQQQQQQLQQQRLQQQQQQRQAPPPQQRVAPPPPPPQQQRAAPPPPPPQQRAAPPPPPPQQRAAPPPQRQPEKPKCGLPGLPPCPR